MAKTRYALVPLYLMSCYLYYKRDVSIISDSKFDRLCQKLYENFDKLQHPHKWLLSKESLKAGTGYEFDWDNPPTEQHRLAFQRIIQAAKLAAKLDQYEEPS